MVGERRGVDDQKFDWLELIQTISGFALLNMLWLFCSLFIITMPAATAALFATVAPWGRGQSPSESLVKFFTGMRRYWLKATAVTLLNLIISSFILFNILILQQMDTSQIINLLSLSVTVAVAFVLILMNIYFWPLLVTLEQSLPDLLKNALKLTIAHPFWGALVAITAVIPLLISLILPQAFLITITFASIALIVYAGAWRIIQRYLDEESLQNVKGSQNL